ncbi:MAG TPA: asparagine synthase (glutamine-hydrolyzing) [Steroidobacteraceae bacterium]|jgi:asparagine synthase (glutamine-hydrolysing)|nr:asparagine synthase (glutamine-hydrolyzing) [Steroidobacteraceae bacterium]
MCGIVGIVGAGAADPQALGRMLDALAYRGPDDEGRFVGEGAALGHRRLSIIDLSTGHQPLHDARKSLWLVANGEIYNYKELRQELQTRGHQFLTNSDCEVILHLYREYGEDCLKYLRGMFAFALWDTEKQQLFAARDHLGQKPFFYAEQNGYFAFASEIKGVLAFDSSLRRLNLEALDQYFALRLIAAPRSMFTGVHKLPPGHALVARQGEKARLWRFWNLRYQPKLTGSENELTDALEAEILTALRLHLASDVPVGAFLSGGLDSSLIVAMLAKHCVTGSFPTFTLSVPHQSYDEAPYARQVAELYGTEHHQGTLKLNLAESLPKLVWHLDEPSDPLALCTYELAEFTRRTVKVVIGGDGGDELFGGYDRYYGYQYAELYAQLPAAVRRHVIGPMLRMVPTGSWYKSRGHQLRWLQMMSFRSGGARYASSLSYFYFDAEARSRLFTDRTRGALQNFDAEACIREPFERMQAEPLDRMLYADAEVRLADHPVMITDRMTMAHGLEARSPFMDHILAEFAARLPCDMKVRGKSLRYIQRLLASRYLPQSLLQRPKQGFSVAMPYLLQQEYRRLYAAMLPSSQLVQDGILRAAPMNALVAEHLSGKADHGNRLWLLLNAEAWYRMHIKNMSAEQLQMDAEATPSRVA